MSLRSLAIAGGLLVGLGITTVAQAAYTTGSVNVRSGPGTNYYVITTAPAGAWVNVASCVPGWCQVGYRGITGWMASSFIARSAAPRYYPPPPPPVYYAPPPPPVVYYPRPYRPY